MFLPCGAEVELRLVVWKGRLPNEVVRVDWKNDEGEYSWLSTGWAPTEEDYLPKGIIGEKMTFMKLLPASSPTVV